MDDDEIVPLAVWEKEVAGRINEARREFGFGELELLPREEMRVIVRDAPEKDLARFRYFSRRLGEDPLPDRMHGLWHPTVVAGMLPHDAAWLALEHPISRSALLDPAMAMLVFGAAPVGFEQAIVLVPIEPAPDAASAADAAREELSGRVAGGLRPAEHLEAALVEIAAGIASGKTSSRDFFAPIRRLSKKGDMVGGSVGATAVVVPPGSRPDISDFELPAGAGYVAVGDAVGDLGRGDGVQYTVLVIVVASRAR